MKWIQKGMTNTTELFHLWRELSQNWLIDVVNKFVLLCFLLSVGLFVWRYSKLPTEIPLWYSQPWGSDRLAHPLWLLSLPLSSLLIYIINILLSLTITKNYLIFSQILLLGSFLVSFLSLITLVKIIFLVT